MASKLIARLRYLSAQPPEQLLAALGARTEPLEGGFTFVSKLSGGGVVVRTLRAPVTDLDWFGSVSEAGFRLAMVVRDRSGSPYQPLIGGQVTPHAGGCAVDLELAPHPDARAYAVFYTVGGVLLGGASLLGFTHSVPTGAVGLVFAFLFLAFPGFRARVAFGHECQKVLAAFEQQFAVTRVEEDPPAV